MKKKKRSGPKSTMKLLEHTMDYLQWVNSLKSSVSRLESIERTFQKVKTMNFPNLINYSRVEKFNTFINSKKKEKKNEKFIEELMDNSLKLLQYKYPNHNKDCLQRIFAEQIKIEHHSLLGELI